MYSPYSVYRLVTEEVYRLCHFLVLGVVAQVECMTPVVLMLKGHDGCFHVGCQVVLVAHVADNDVPDYLNEVVERDVLLGTDFH